ncbi:DUF4350 domain-containing protein [Olivibacter sp. SDN3]|uniref:DUF4350 domain-containing protein n=1 Tax=Olivibacter sp. SDN3 TaxID=2764720 RepID=UPI0016514927|nr:DUF4350 domain-containing protein [Olivibacter sp. SDN3]QNL50663.1 DUF4350 domain-containing protein [Olivibacter sp. SDN3]
MKDLKTYLFIAGTLLGLYLIVEYNKPIPVDWTPTFNKSDKIPFGTYVLYHELPRLFSEGISSSRQSIYEALNNRTDNANLLIVSPKVNISNTDYERMKAYMADGHAIFIASHSFNYAFLDSLNLAIQSRDVLFAKDSLNFRFTNSLLDSNKLYTYERGIGVHYFSKFDTTKAVILARNNKDDANFLKYDFGKGSLFLLASPDFFSNYALLSQDGSTFASHALSYLSDQRKLLFDEYQLLGTQGAQSILRVIFATPSLKWAYYLALFSMVLFILYEIKRRQRIIPVEDPMRNTSVEFAKVVGGVYYQQRDNKDIGHKKIIYLLNFIRTNYRLKTSELNEEFVDLLTHRSGVGRETIDKIIQEIKEVYGGKYLSDQELITLNNNIETFYEQSGTTWKKNFSQNEPT